jgi:hypothetical protein
VALHHGLGVLEQGAEADSAPGAGDPEIESVADLVELFPGLGRLGLAEQTKLVVVNRFRPTEIFVKLCKLKFGDGPKIKGRVT